MVKEKRQSKKQVPVPTVRVVKDMPTQVIGDEDPLPVQRAPMGGAPPQEIEDSNSTSESEDSSSSSSTSLPDFQQMAMAQRHVGSLEGEAEPQVLKAASSPASPGEARDAQIDVPVPMPNPKPSTDPQPEAAGASEEAEPKSFPKRAPKPGSITFNMQGAQKALAAARTRVQVQSAVEAAKAKRLNVKDAATQTVRDPERQDGDIVTIWRLRPRGMESFPHFAKPKARRTRFAEILAKEGGAIDPHDPSERKRARVAAADADATKEVTIDLEGREHGGDDAELSGGEAAVADPYQTTFEEVDAVDAA